MCDDEHRVRSSQASMTICWQKLSHSLNSKHDKYIPLPLEEVSLLATTGLLHSVNNYNKTIIVVLDILFATHGAY